MNFTGKVSIRAQGPVFHVYIHRPGATTVRIGYGFNDFNKATAMAIAGALIFRPFGPVGDRPPGYDPHGDWQRRTRARQLRRSRRLVPLVPPGHD